MLEMNMLKKQLDLLRKRQGSLGAESDNDLFPVWLLLALASSREKDVVASITGGKNDGDMDAIFVDENAVWIVQGKLHRTAGKDTESANEVRRFAGLAELLFAEDTEPRRRELVRRLAKNSRGAKSKFEEASRVAREHNFAVHLVFATNGKFTRRVEDSATRAVGRVSNRASLSLLDYREVAQLLANYIRDVAPAVPELRLNVVGGELRPQSASGSKLKAWTVSTTAADVAALQRDGGEQIFARNIRHGLGDVVRVNKEIRRTLMDHPDRFWFLNNGLTIACQSASIKDEEVVMRGAQIINGQQTTRTLHATIEEGGVSEGSLAARVSVRVLSFQDVPLSEADDLIAKVVEATNFQNSISKADLRSNDTRQIELARALASRGYLYVRKKGKQDSPTGLSYLKRKVKRETLFAAAAGTLYDSVALREGRDPLFDTEREYYDEVLSCTTDYLLASYLHWQIVAKRLKKNDIYKAAKYVVQYHAFQKILGRFKSRLGDVVRDLEVQGSELRPQVDRVIDAHLRIAARSFRRNRRVDGSMLAPKPYFQRERSSSDFEREMTKPTSRTNRHAIESALKAMQETLDAAS